MGFQRGSSAALYAMRSVARRIEGRGGKMYVPRAMYSLRMSFCVVPPIRSEATPCCLPTAPYIAGCTPRVYGGSPGSPGSDPLGSNTGGIRAPYVVSNFARSGTRLIASAYVERSQSARSRLFLGIAAMVAVEGALPPRTPGLSRAEDERPFEAAET